MGDEHTITYYRIHFLVFLLSQVLFLVGVKVGGVGVAYLYIYKEHLYWKNLVEKR